MTEQINYTVLTLKESELDDAMSMLMKNEEYYFFWIKWLKNNSAKYGEEYLDWKPFDNRSICELIKNRTNQNIEFYPRIEILEEENPDIIKVVRNYLECEINLLFIDPLAFLLEKNQNLLVRIMAMIAKGKDCFCCVIEPNINCPTLSKICDEKLENIDFYYRRKGVHRFTSKKRDFESFINAVDKLPKTQKKMNNDNSSKIPSRNNYKVPYI